MILPVVTVVTIVIALPVKEGTTGGVVQGNTLSGKGASAADSWIDVKGNSWVITGNTGSTTTQDGIQVHSVVQGWGRNEQFRDNRLTVNAPGYGIYVQSPSLGAVVACSNTATGARSGLSNLPCG